MNPHTDTSLPPFLVTVAVVLLGFPFAAGIVKWACLSSWSSPIANLLVLAIFILLVGWVLRSIRRGNNPLRWLFVVLFSIGVVEAWWQPQTFTYTWEPLFFWAQALIQLPALVILFLPESNRWFSRRRDAKNSIAVTEQS